MDTKPTTSQPSDTTPPEGQASGATLCSATDTPETDALLLVINEGRVYNTDGPVDNLARRLERERDEARAIASHWRNNAENGWDGYNSSFPWEL